MRVDHFVVKPPKKNTYNNTGDNMSNNALTTPSITKSMGFAPSHSVWSKMHSNSLVGTGKRVYGRIIDTGANYIVDGWNMNHEWVRIPCRRLQDAEVLIAKVMRKETFDILRNGQ